jgi:diguanylate cyclase (GGDEF)-like protein/PAS domain S-box-containing protein
MSRPDSNTIPDADLCRDILESCIDAVISLDEQGCCIFINEVATNVLGVSRDEVMGVHIRDAVPGPWDKVLFTMFQKARETDEILLIEVTGAMPDTWFECRARRHAKAVSFFLWDISERRLVERALRDSEARLAHDAFHDSLTGLPNRSLFMDRLEHAFSVRKRRSDFQFAVLFMDLDRFKNVNDSLGHGIGDELLCVVAEKIQRCIRAMDMAARVGGDEFVVLLEELRDESGAIHVADRIIRELALPVEIQGHEVFTATSVGIGLSSSNYKDAEEILRDADTAMYRAKADGGSRYLVADVQMQRQILERLDLEAALRRAVARKELTAEYQPIVSVGDGRLKGFEALVRWKREDGGSVSPGRFLPIAEELGLAVKIGLRVLSQACAEAVRSAPRQPTCMSASTCRPASSRPVRSPTMCAWSWTRLVWIPPACALKSPRRYCWSRIRNSEGNFPKSRRWESTCRWTISGPGTRPCRTCTNSRWTG